MLDRLIDAHNLCIGFSADETREPVAGVAANAATLLRILLVEHDPDWNVEGLQAGAREVIRQLLNTWLVADGRPGIRSLGRRFRWILAAITMHLIKILGLRVIRLQFVITDRPRRRNAAVVS